MSALHVPPGVSIEGSAVSTRESVNLDFYGRPVTARQLLLEERFAPPIAAAALYRSLDDMLARVGAPNLPRSVPLVHRVRRAAASLLRRSTSSL